MNCSKIYRPSLIKISVVYSPLKNGVSGSTAALY